MFGMQIGGKTVSVDGTQERMAMQDVRASSYGGWVVHNVGLTLNDNNLEQMARANAKSKPDTQYTIQFTNEAGEEREYTGTMEFLLSPECYEKYQVFLAVEQRKQTIDEVLEDLDKNNDQQ